MTMNNFELKYGEADDYMNQYRMLDFKIVRNKNYKTMVNKVNVKLKHLRSESTSKMNSTDRQRMPSIIDWLDTN